MSSIEPEPDYPQFMQGSANSLAPGNIVVMDNLPVHKVAGITEIIAEQKGQLFYLPPFDRHA
jgi:transposase